MESFVLMWFSPVVAARAGDDPARKIFPGPSKQSYVNGTLIECEQSMKRKIVKAEFLKVRDSHREP